MFRATQGGITTALAFVSAAPAIAQAWTCHLTEVCSPRECRQFDILVPLQISPTGTARFGVAGDRLTLRAVPTVLGGEAEASGPRLFVGPDDYGAAVLALRGDGGFVMTMLAEHTAGPWEAASGACEEDE